MTRLLLYLKSTLAFSTLLQSLVLATIPNSSTALKIAQFKKDSETLHANTKEIYFEFSLDIPELNTKACYERL